MLERIKSPGDLATLSNDELAALAQELRETLISTVSKQGGHLASNLGIVELTMALHIVLNCPEDKLIFDVGHQSYVHKLLTGRQAGFQRLRSDEGVSGFPKRSESEYDCFETGHASTAISAAVGFVRARGMAAQEHKVVAVVGDGALTGGLCYEAFNDIGAKPRQLLVVLNDNAMSISRNVGAMAAHLTRLRASQSWHGTKQVVKHGVERIPVVGDVISRALEWTKNGIRNLMVPPGALFESLGFRYLGPIDGHNVETLTEVLENALALDYPTLLHVITQKGHGFTPAETRPEDYHGVAPFFIEDDKEATHTESCAKTVGETLCAMAGTDARVAGITAAMPTGTGLDQFAQAYPERFFDVGIAEEHAVTMAAGMAAGGMRPYVAIYSSFLQRAYDQVVHDVCQQNLPVTFLLDRAGFVPGDGSTHQGIFDIGFLRGIPNMTLWAPSDLQELAHMLRVSLTLPGPCAIRYPKALPPLMANHRDENPGTWHMAKSGQHVALLAFGPMLQEAYACAVLLEAQGISAAVVRAAGIKPLDEAMLCQLMDAKLRLVTMEEQQCAGGFGSGVAEYCLQAGRVQPLCLFGVTDRFAQRHTVRGLREENGLTAEQMAQAIAKAWEAQA